jgi:tetratricopeptide (TPR) repeat protein
MVMTEMEAYAKILKKGDCMTLFQFLLLAMTGYFSFQMYQHIQTLEDDEKRKGTENNAEDIENAKSLEKEADLLFEKGDLQRAFKILDEANLKDPNNANILAKMGYILGQEERNDEAIFYYKKALHLEFSNDMIHNALASLYKKMGEYEEAQNHYEEALKIDSEYEVTYYNYANLLVEIGQKKRALFMYEKALELNPDFTQAKDEIVKLKESM